MAANIEYQGGKTVAALNPMLFQAHAALVALLGPLLLELNARLSGYIKLQASIGLKPPSISAGFEAAVKLSIALSAYLALGLPAISLSFSLMADLIFELKARIGGLGLILDFAASIPLQTGGLHVYAIDGKVPDFGDAVNSMLHSGVPGGAPADEGLALLVVTTSGQGKDALGVCYGVKAKTPTSVTIGG